MIEFNLKGISVSAMVEMERYDYRDNSGHYKTRFNRNTLATANFWGFVIDNDLYELATVKSTLNYFMQAYWKRSSRAGSKIELATALKHHNVGSQQALYLVARQKDGIHSLEVSLTEKGTCAGKIYLSAQEVIMLDIAIGKVISLLTPKTVYVADTLHT